MAEIPVIGKPMVGIAGGMQDGIMLPVLLLLTLLMKKLLGMNRPEVIKDDLGQR